MGLNTRRKSSRRTSVESDDEFAKNNVCCGLICTKSMSIIFNFLFIITGILVSLVGLWIIIYKQEYLHLLSASLYKISTYILIGAGFMIVITGIMGILSAWFENKKILNLYFILLVTIFIIELTTGFLVFIYRAKLRESIKSDLENVIKNEYGKEEFKMKTDLLDELQQKFKCCGASSFFDWRNSSYAVNQQLNSAIDFNLVAESCCKTPSKLCAKRDHPSNINVYGCVVSLEKYIISQLFIISTAGLVVCLIQLIGILITALLIQRVKQRKQYSTLKSSEPDS